MFYRDWAASAIRLIQSPHVLTAFYMSVTQLSCVSPCDSLECSGDQLTSTLKVFLQASTTTDIRTQPTLEITAPLDYGFQWSYDTRLSDSMEFWIGTPTTQSIQTIEWQIGAVELSDPYLNGTSTQFGEHLVVIDDIAVVGSPLFDGELVHSGQIEIWDLNSGTSLSTLRGINSFQTLPRALWSCGDLDGDSVPDWIASDLADNGNGRIWLGLSQIWLNLSGINNIDALPYLQGALTEEAFGGQVLCDRDWNNDDHIDLVVSSPFANVNGNNGAGRISLWLNDSNGRFDTPYKSVNGAIAEGWLGYRITSGDVDGDGIPELASTTFEKENTAVQFYSFKNGGWQERYRLRPRFPDSFWGYSIELADVNGDGLDDVLVAAPLADVPPYKDAGGIEIYPGTTNLLDWIDGPQEIRGTESNQRLGIHLSTADCNQDGLLDIIAQGYRTTVPQRNR